jgi:DNA-binding NarL/FixJ family response regulator
MKHVLIIDDSQPIRERIASLLDEFPQIQIIGQAGTKREGWQVLQSLRPDTVILDIRLPDESGIQLLKEIKASHPEINVIMLTNFDFQQYRRQCRHLGADYFLSKTREFDKIVEAVLNQGEN